MGIKLLPVNDCKSRDKRVFTIEPRPALIKDTNDLWVDSLGHVYIIVDNVAHMLLGYRLGGTPLNARAYYKRFRCFDEETDGIEFEDGDDYLEIPTWQGGASMEDKYKWQENYTKFSVQLNNSKDKDIIDEAKRRKDKYNTATSYTMRRWVRLGYEADMQDDGE